MWELDSVVMYFYIGLAVLGVWAISQAWLSQSRTETIHPFKAFVHLLAFYLSYLLIPLFFFSFYAGWSGYYSLHEAIFVGAVTGFCAMPVYRAAHDSGEKMPISIA
jgi:hypothetical protein